MFLLTQSVTGQVRCQVTGRNPTRKELCALSDFVQPSLSNPMLSQGCREVRPKNETRTAKVIFNPLDMRQLLERERLIYEVRTAGEASAGWTNCRSYSSW